jgi:tRNA (guanine-N7-)-methyltransferase
LLPFRWIFYAFALAKGWELLAHTFDLHHNEEMNKGNIMTEYEVKFSAKGQPINKLIATRK